MSEHTYTLTFSEAVESHVGMAITGNKCNPREGFSIDDLREIASRYPQNSELISLNTTYNGIPIPEQEPASILIIRNGLQLFNIDHMALYNEQRLLEKDTKAFMYGRVVNKHARHNLCFADEGHSADFERGISTVLPFCELPYTNNLRNVLYEKIGNKAYNLNAEGNYYYDNSRTYIGWHFDAERHKVIGVRLGYSMNLYYRWYKDSKCQSDDCTILLNHGDIYIPSEKAVGTDGRKKKIWTLKHAAGCKKYIK